MLSLKEYFTENFFVFEEDDLVRRTTFELTECCLIEPLWSYDCYSDSSVIRYRVSLPELNDANGVFLNLDFEISAQVGSVAHFSVVNSNVTDGEIWGVQEEKFPQRFNISSWVNNPGQSLVFYINLSNACSVKFKLNRLVAVRFFSSRPINILFHIDPWIERSKLLWKDDYIWWFGKIEKALKEVGLPFKFSYFMSDAVADRWDSYKASNDSKLASVRVSDLINITQSNRKGVILQRTRKKIKNKYCFQTPVAMAAQPSQSDAQQGILNILRGLSEDEPDIIFSISDLQLAKDAFPGAVILFRDALYCREPFPDELTWFDTKGLYRNSGIGDFLKLDGDVNPSFFNLVEEFFKKTDSVTSVLDKYSLLNAPFLLLPLQDSSHYNFFDESPFVDQVDLIFVAAKKFQDKKILFTQHPDKNELSAESISVLLKICPNLIYISDFERYSNLSARLLPYAEGVIGVSSGILMQALFLGLPVYFLGEHQLSNILSSISNSGDRQKVAYALLLRVCFSYRYLYNPKWLIARIISLSLYSFGLIDSGSVSVDFPGNIIKNLLSDRRAISL